MLDPAVLFMYLSHFWLLRGCHALKSIDPTQSLRDGETLVSKGSIFELGFFSPAGADSRVRYLGLWYKNISPRTIVWVADREAPLSDTSGALNVTKRGVLVLLNSTNNAIWSSDSSRTAQDPVAELLDSGNLVVRDRNNEKQDDLLWQSFDYPCDTFLPGMKLGKNLKTGFEWFFSSWKAVGDPATGNFSTRLDLRGYPQLVIRKGSMIQYRAGSWNGLRFSGAPELMQNQMFTYNFVLTDNEVYYKYESPKNAPLVRYTLSPSGHGQRFLWDERSKDWQLFAVMQADQCDNYGLCGAYGSCNTINSSVCACLNGFKPKFPTKWNLREWSGGCIRRTPLECNRKDGFRKYGGIKLPDTSSCWYDNTTGLQECAALCLKNCSCTAYANLDIRGSGCLLWFADLIDIRHLSEGGQDLYIRLAASELATTKKELPSNKKKQVAIAASSAIFAAILLVGSISYLFKRNLRKHENLKDEVTEEDMELPIFDLGAISKATNNFSSSNKIGEGGFGPVYKGVLIDGQEIAVKRLSKSSGQGINEFKNEIILIAKLQHRNLVRLLGCCINDDEKMLIYEYMPNKSLDSFIFDQAQSKLLDWSRRFHIIGGIARGLVYLHEDSRLRIIHRDLKASNILLDNQMNPKISDFGLARIFGGNQTEDNTNRVVGTYGYMSPEYAMGGHFSVKSDVFSFGVLALEILSGKKNRGFSHPDNLLLNLLGYAWMLWTKGTPLQLVDENLTDSRIESEVLRCIHVALLCVQQQPEDRPSMSSVVVMLSSENTLPQPKQPGFYMVANPSDLSTKTESYSLNGVSISLLEAR